MPNTVDRHSACVIDENTIMTIGGCCGGGLICKYKIKEKTWEKLQVTCNLQNFTSFYVKELNSILYFGREQEIFGLDLNEEKQKSFGESKFQGYGRIVVTSPVQVRDKLYLWNSFCELFVFDLKSLKFQDINIKNNKQYVQKSISSQYK